MACSIEEVPASPQWLFKKPQLKDLCDIVRTSRWYQLGVQLEMDPSCLNDIRDNNINYPSQDLKRTRMFELWLSTDPQATNKKLLEVLQKKVIGEDSVAKKYETRLKECNMKGVDVNASTGIPTVDPPTSQAIRLMTEKVTTVKELRDMAQILKEKFHKLLVYMQSTCRSEAGGVEPMKNILRLVLQESSLQQSQAIRHYGREIDAMQTTDDVFQFLVEKHFVGYLNYQLLKEFATKAICGAGKKKAKEKIAKYSKHYKDFLKLPQFTSLIQVFDENPHLNPSAIIGLPILMVSLASSWKERTSGDLEEYVKLFKSTKLSLQSMGYKCILVTYAIFPIDIPKVIRFLSNTDRMKKLKDEGITLDVSADAYEMAKLLPEEEEEEDEEEEESLRSCIMKLQHRFEESQAQLLHNQKKLLRSQAELQKMLSQVLEYQTSGGKLPPTETPPSQDTSAQVRRRVNSYAGMMARDSGIGFNDIKLC